VQHDGVDNAAERPVASASTDSSTATTPAVPMTMTAEEAARLGRLRRLIEETASSWVIVFMS
jgi:hypothetical protein